VKYLRTDTNHLACIQQFEAAGIYILVGLDAPGESLIEKQIWDRSMQKRYQLIIDSLLPFTNILGFYIRSSPITVPLTRAAIRDTKVYIENRSTRQIPLGYYGGSWYDDISGDILNCGDQTISADFKIYRIDYRLLCHVNSEVRSKFLQTLAKQQTNYSFPLILSQGPCENGTQTNIEAIEGISSKGFDDFYSGFIMFSYFDDLNTNSTGK
jgi:1,3-beta-glucanosyltransferase GAS1